MSCFSHGSAATLLRWGGIFYNYVVCNILWIPYSKNYHNRLIFRRVIQNIKGGVFWDTAYKHKTVNCVDESALFLKLLLAFLWSKSVVGNLVRQRYFSLQSYYMYCVCVCRWVVIRWFWARFRSSVALFLSLLSFWLSSFSPSSGSESVTKSLQRSEWSQRHVNIRMLYKRSFQLQVAKCVD